MVAYNRPDELVAPDAAAFAQSERLSSAIAQEIMDANGAISFARFMELALYAPELGYYASGRVKFGEQGDFLTAPEISPLFAHCVARQCQQILEVLPGADILEIGAGSGIFAQGLLLALEKMAALPTTYFIYEISAALRERQRACLLHYCPHLVSRVQWLETLDGFTLTGIIFANEVMDALPVHCVQILEYQLTERSVTWQEGHFAWCLTQPTVDLQNACAPILQQGTFPGAYLTEVNLRAPAWTADLANNLQQGVILLVDYGYGQADYYHPDRAMGTLQCYYQHRRHDCPLQWPGLQDITAHVDFTRVLESALAAGCDFAGFTTQSGFLLSSGLLQWLETASLSAKDRYHHTQAIKKLILPGQMGELIKVLAVSKLFEQPLLGFSQFDRQRDL